MSLISKSFTAVDVGTAISLKAGQSADYFVSGTFVGTYVLQRSLNGGTTYEQVATGTGAGSGTVTAPDNQGAIYRFRCSAYTSGTMVTKIQEEGSKIDVDYLSTVLGAVPNVAGLTANMKYDADTGLFRIDYDLNAVQLAVTDAGAGGSSASLKIFDFVQAVVVPSGCRQDYTAFVEGAALTTGAGDASFVMGLGSVAANAADGALTGTEVDFGSVTGAITLVAGVGAGTQVSGNLSTALNGTATATDLYLNWSGTAATIDANSTIDVTGTITVTGQLLGDD